MRGDAGCPYESMPELPQPRARGVDRVPPLWRGALGAAAVRVGAPRRSDHAPTAPGRTRLRPRAVETAARARHVAPACGARQLAPACSARKRAPAAAVATGR